MGLTRFLAKIATDYENPQSIGSRFRRRRIRPLLDTIDAVYRQNGRVEIIDLGGTPTYWKLLPDQLFSNKNITVTIVNLPGMNKPVDKGHFRFVDGDACNLDQFADNSFHIVHSNSVIEHVGDWKRMMSFAATVQRLAPNYFVQTPHFWFPVEPHFMCPFFHWLPEPIRVTLVMHFNLGHYERQNTVDQAVRAVQGARLLDRKMFRCLFPDGDTRTERVFLLPKSLIALRIRESACTQ